VTALDLADVRMVFNPGSANEVVALDGIDLKIEPGEFVSLIGPSGCGKSTMLRVIGDLITPSGGTASVHGKPAHQARLDRDYGMVFQSSTLLEWRRVVDNVELPLELMGVDRSERRTRAVLRSESCCAAWAACPMRRQPCSTRSSSTSRCRR
jgi:NitT/TauT family transport system ATP-binding protein